MAKPVTPAPITATQSSELPFALSEVEVRAPPSPHGNPVVFDFAQAERMHRAWKKGPGIAPQAFSILAVPQGQAGPVPGEAEAPPVPAPT